MTMFGSQWLANAGSTYEIDQSIRFNDNDSAYLSRTPSSAGNRRTFTFSCWVKRANLTGANQPIFSAGSNDWLMFQSAETLGFKTSSSNYSIITTQVFRDPTAWFHLVMRVDTTNATAGDRLRLYINGAEVTAFGTDSNPTLNFDTAFNNTGEHDIGKLVGSSTYFDGYLAEINHVDGSSLAPSSFGKTSSTTGQWIPKRYSGSYGTNGFYITGEDSSDLGDDESGSGNDFSSSGLATNDQVIDTPTNNFATYSPINLDSVTLADGNLFCDSSSYWSGAAATMSFPTSGKWYIENLVGNRYGSYACQGFVPTNYKQITSAGEAIYYASYGATYASLDWGFGVNMNQSKFGFYVDGSGTAYNIYKPDGSTSLYSTGDLYVCHALDLDNERYWVGTALTTDSSVTWYGPSGSGADPTNASTGVDISTYLDKYGSYGLTWYHSANQTSGTPDSTIDFGQHGFKFTKPTDYSRLCTADLSDPAISDPSAYFQATTYTGNGSTQSINQSGNSTFQPDFVWIKNRDATDSHVLTDAVRGATKILAADTTGVESTDTDTLTAFESDGFALGADVKVNTNTEDYIAWQWKANGSGSSNTDGSINTTSTSVYTTAGVSISTYTGTGSAATIGHGLGVAPSVVMVKKRESGTDDAWIVWHKRLSGPNYYLNLNDSGAETTDTNYWNNTLPTSSVFHVGASNGTNQSTKTFVAYCFAEIEGFSKFGSYVGTGSSGNNGPFVDTGFKPKFIIIKGGQNWTMWDTARSPYNMLNDNLWCDLNSAESTSTSYSRDILSNGFKPRGTHAIVNGSGTTYVYMAFAESPLKTATAF